MLRLRSNLFAALSALVVVFAASACKEKKKEEASPPPPAAQAVAAPPAATPAPAAAPASGAEDAGLFTIPKTRYAKGEDVVITYKSPVTSSGTNKHWITIAKPGDVESAWGVWHYVEPGATVDKVQPPNTGSWEIRFHDVYPKWAGGRILAKATITVE